MRLLAERFYHLFRFCNLKVKVSNEGIPFNISLSINLRSFCNLSTEIKNKIEKIGKDLAEQFENDSELNDSLKNDPAHKLGCRVMRQVDMRADNGDILIKTFISWNYKLNSWHILMELPDELVWENGERNF